MKRAKETFNAKVKQMFSYDVADISEYVDMTSEELIPTLVETSPFLSKVFVDTEVKNKKSIKLFDVTLDVEARGACDVTETSGGIDFQEVTLETERVGFLDKFCNADLVGKWTQLLLRSGAKAELETLPAESQMTALYALKLRNTVEDLVWLADTDSASANLNMFDGLVKQLANDPAVISVPNVTVSASNAYETFLAIQRAIPKAIFDNNVPVEILCSQTDFNFLVDNLMNDNNFHYTANIQGGDATGQYLSLPGSNTTVRVQRQLVTGQIYAVPYQYITVGTDAESDLSGISAEFVPHEKNIWVEGAMYLGVAYARGEYFVKLDEAAS